MVQLLTATSTVLCHAKDVKQAVVTKSGFARVLLSTGSVNVQELEQEAGIPNASRRLRARKRVNTYNHATV